VDKSAIKAAIREELGRKVAMSGGPEVFRRLVRGEAGLVEAALQELVQEGLLSETRLRVGKIYHYPANSATRLDVLAGFMKKMAEAPARPARPAHGAPAARDPNAPRPTPAAVEGSAAPPAAAVPPAPAPAPATTAEDDEKAAWVPKRATPRDPNKPRPVPRDPSAPAPAAPSAPAAPEATASVAQVPVDAPKEPWVPKRAAPRDPNKPRAMPRDPDAPRAAAPAVPAPGAEPTAPTPEEESHG
jgi:hypothetical protein